MLRSTEAARYLPCSLLWQAANLGYATICETLIEWGHADVNSSNPQVYGHTALHIACQSSHVGVVKVLVKNGADLDAVNADNNKVDVFISNSEIRRVIDDARAKLADTEEESKMVR